MNIKDYKYIIGIDEAGRGPLAGPVVVGAFCVAVKDINYVLAELYGIIDSKKLTAKKRNQYVKKIKELQKQKLLSVGISGVSAKIIDTKGIVHAIKSALTGSLQKLQIEPHEVFVYLDGGLFAPPEYQYQETIIQGDSKIWQIGAASVVAKVARDQKMLDYAKKYPLYGFEHHKGYGTQKHRYAIKKYGTTEIHRVSWIKN
jgi:ribonuclease HII